MGVVEFSSDAACHHCSKTAQEAGAAAAGLLRCSRCRSALYCSKDCQLAAWKAGHRDRCAQQTQERAATKAEFGPKFHKSLDKWQEGVAEFLLGSAMKALGMVSSNKQRSGSSINATHALVLHMAYDPVVDATKGLHFTVVLHEVMPIARANEQFRLSALHQMKDRMEGDEIMVIYDVVQAPRARWPLLRAEDWGDDAKSFCKMVYMEADEDVPFSVTEMLLRTPLPELIQMMNDE